MELEVQRVYKKKLPFRRMGKGGKRMNAIDFCFYTFIPIAFMVITCLAFIIIVIVAIKELKK